MAHLLLLAPTLISSYSSSVYTQSLSPISYEQNQQENAWDG